MVLLVSYSIFVILAFVLLEPFLYDIEFIFFKWMANFFVVVVNFKCHFFQKLPEFCLSCTHSFANITFKGYISHLNIINILIHTGGHY